jgi:hypothetical protein
MSDQEITGMYELVDALEATLQSADPDKREALAKVIDAYHNFPEEFHWAIGARAPTLLHNLMMAIGVVCRPNKQDRSRGIIRLVDRKPDGA